MRPNIDATWAKRVAKAFSAHYPPDLREVRGCRDRASLIETGLIKLNGERDSCLKLWTKSNDVISEVRSIDLNL